MQKEHKKTTRPRRVSPIFHLELDGGHFGNSLMVDGVLGISEYSDTLVKIILKWGALTLYGNNLQIELYRGNIVEISGNVENIAMKYIRGGIKSEN